MPPQCSDWIRCTSGCSSHSWPCSDWCSWRIGIDVGSLVIGHIGHAGTASVTVIGNTVNAASRLEALTKEKGCQLIVSADVLARAGVDLDGFPREEVAIRGLSAGRQVVVIGRARDLPHIAEPEPARGMTAEGSVPGAG